MKKKNCYCPPQTDIYNVCMETGLLAASLEQFEDDPESIWIAMAPIDIPFIF